VIYWLIQTTADHPNLLQDAPPKGLLSKEETAVYNNLKTAKRRQDWLLGRWTAKKLLQELIRGNNGQTISSELISIIAAEDGAPSVRIDPAAGKSDLQFTISISHSHDTSFCAAVQNPEWVLGADLEWVEARPPRFIDDYFTDKERVFLQGIAPQLLDMYVTAFWSAKEAALKAVRQGLRFDTRSIECQLEDVESALEDWVPIQFRWCRQAAELHLPKLKGWWKSTGKYVLTLAIAEKQEK
jgi:4'-phosphopantetheinyl transferase